MSQEDTGTQSAAAQDDGPSSAWKTREGEFQDPCVPPTFSESTLALVGGRVADQSQGPGIAPLCEAISDGDVNRLQILLEEGASVNGRNMNGSSPLHIASFFGHVPIVKTLLKHRADVDFENPYGFNALLFAVREGHMDVTRLLVQAGADVSVSVPRIYYDDTGHIGDAVPVSVLLHVLFNLEYSMAATFLEAGAIPHQLESYNDDSFMWFCAIRNQVDGFFDLLKRLTRAGFNCYSPLWVDSNSLRRNDNFFADRLSQTERDIFDFMVYEHQNVPPLQRLCRTVIRTSLSRSRIRQVHLKEKVSQLPLPIRMKKFVMLENE